MSRKALVYKCSICNKVRSTELLTSVKGVDILESPITEVDMGSRKIKWYEYLDVLSKRMMSILIRTWRIAFVSTLILGGLLFFINHDSWNDIVYNLNSNLRSLKIVIYRDGVEQMVQQCQNCYLSILFSSGANVPLLKNGNLFIQTDVKIDIFNSIRNKCLIVLQNKQLLEDEVLKKIVNVANMVSVLWLNIKELCGILSDNANMSYHNLHRRVKDVKCLVERKFGK